MASNTEEPRTINQATLRVLARFEYRRILNERLRQACEREDVVLDGILQGIYKEDSFKFLDSFSKQRLMHEQEKEIYGSTMVQRTRTIADIIKENEYMNNGSLRGLFDKAISLDALGIESSVSGFQPAITLTASGIFISINRDDYQRLDSDNLPVMRLPASALQEGCPQELADVCYVVPKDDSGTSYSGVQLASALISPVWQKLYMKLKRFDHVSDFVKEVGHEVLEMERRLIETATAYTMVKGTCSEQDLLQGLQTTHRLFAEQLGSSSEPAHYSYDSLVSYIDSCFNSVTQKYQQQYRISAEQTEEDQYFALVKEYVDKIKQRISLLLPDIDYYPTQATTGREGGGMDVKPYIDRVKQISPEGQGDQRDQRSPSSQKPRLKIPSRVKGLAMTDGYYLKSMVLLTSERIPKSGNAPFLKVMFHLVQALGYNGENENKYEPDVTLFKQMVEDKTIIF